MTESLFESLPEVPEQISAANVIARLIDGVGFRYRLATDGLKETELEFRPAPTSMNLYELLIHIYDLAFVADSTLGGPTSHKKGSLKSFLDLRNETLMLYEGLSIRLKSMEDSELEAFKVRPGSFSREFPFWFIINGHIADALTHIGQINSWRRMVGNPCPKISVFNGRQLS
ncbi:hypothetical protein QQ008_25210 [Fulvivirgaceae bacterium BMA10]|uniref:DinB family protein n=1 Tax=Splendidivirga corallicola TaxID=3051826 RepID=A0ABT8KVB7_9BACT|nr:hypothetical protein [Fulvivirgaceae bacterium BMA10]